MLFYKIWKKNEIKLTKHKMGLNNRKLKIIHPLVRTDQNFIIISAADSAFVLNIKFRLELYGEYLNTELTCHNFSNRSLNYLLLTILFPLLKKRKICLTSELR